VPWCGRIEAFADAELERVIRKLKRRRRGRNKVLVVERLSV